MLARFARFLTHQLITKKMAASEIDIQRSADLLLHQHGTGAVDEAERRLAHFRAAGDEEGTALWEGISRAIADLLRPPPGPLN